MLSFLNGGGRMAEVIRAHDWTSSPLGEPAGWSPVLKTNIATMLGNLFPQCLFWGPELIMLYNDGYTPMLGNKPVAIGQRLADAWSDIWQDIEPIAQKALAGEPTFIEDFELVTDRNGYPETAWFTFSYSPVRNEFGKVVGVLDTVVETTPTVLAKRRNELLNHELAHRMKNTFSVINAISVQTFGRADDPDAPHARFNERLAALSDAQELLLHGEWGQAELSDIVSRTIAPHLPAGDALELDGPPVTLSGKQVFSLALATHELATNAAKYGAFGRAGGKVRVGWSAGQPGSDEPFVLSWEETGVGPVDPPTRTGFGTRLVTRMLPMEFGGTARLDYAGDGLRYVLTSSMKSLTV